MRTKKSKVKLIPLGGLCEIGKNITAIEYEDEIIVIDCGLSFPDNEMYGIDLVIPDISYLLENREKVKGIFITHGHEDHIGALPYILKEINVPVYASKFTLSLIESKLIEFNMVSSCSLNEITLKEPIKTEHFACEFIRTCHSIADSCSLAITTPQGVIFHTGDFKIDYTPVDGEVIDLQRISEIGKRRVLLLMADSTNATREGFTISETIIGQNLTRLFRNAKGRVIVATFSSNVHRVQQVINSSITYGRKVAFSGRSMEKISQIAMDLGYLKVPKNTIIKLDDIHKYPDNKVTIITTGSQGEPMSALSRIASGSHKNIGLKEGDYIIISASPIPGNTKLITKLIDILISKGAEVIYDAMEEVHVSGHACREELKLIHSLIKPKYFVPVHGEYRHLKEHAELAKSLGISVLELMRSQKSDMKEKNLSENEVVELMGNAAEITKENQKQEKASVWIGGIVTIIIAILVKLSGLAVSIGGALFAGFMVSLVAISIYFFVENKEDKGSRKIYGFFLLVGVGGSISLFQLMGVDSKIIIRSVYSILFIIVCSSSISKLIYVTISFSVSLTCIS